LKKIDSSEKAASISIGTAVFLFELIVFGKIVA
jgi:hypothetical protein